MMQRDMFRRHFNATISIAELEALDRAKTAAVAAAAASNPTTNSSQAVSYPLLVSSNDSNSLLTKSRNMFRQHFYQKQCDSCYASKVANNAASAAYKEALREYYAEKKNGTELQIPVRPKQVPFIYSINNPSVN